MKYALIISIKKYRIRLAVVLLIIQWSFKRFHFRYRHLKVLTKVSFREFGITLWIINIY